MSANKCRRDKKCKCACVRMRVRVRVRDLLLAPGFLLGSQLRLSLHLLRGGTERGERCVFHNHLQHLSEAACPAFKTCFGFAAINCSRCGDGGWGGRHLLAVGDGACVGAVQDLSELPVWRQLQRA